MDPENNPLAVYLTEIRAVPPLSPTEESGLLKRAREQQDQGAKVRLVESYLARTAEIALRVLPSWMRPIDAISEANLALIGIVDDPAVRRPARVLEQRIRDHLEDLAP